MQYIYGKHREKTRWISALRQTFFIRDFQAMSSHEKHNTENAIRGREGSPDYRWTDDYAGTKPNLLITDLINMERMRNQKITEFVDGCDADGASEYSRDHKSPLEIINRLLKQSNIPVTLAMGRDEKILASKNRSEPYSIARLSDGERSIILIASQIITAPSNTLILIDEPERHLHHSIISSLLKAIFAERPDCAFIVSTHEVDLPMDNHGSIFLVRDCAYNEKSIASWDTILLESRDEMDEGTIRDILGARRKLLFVEGTTDSLDRRLYGLIFPEVAVIPKGSFKNVINAVAGIRGANHLHRIDAYGIVDKDGRTDEDVEKLRKQGIYPLSFYSVESIYYSQEMQKNVCERIASVSESESATRLKNAEDKALAAIDKKTYRLARTVVEYKIHEEISKHLSDLSKLDLLEKTICVCIDIGDKMTDELQRLGEYVKTHDLDSIMSRYPVRKSSALKPIAEELGFRSRRFYENTALTLLKDDEQLLAHVQSLFEPLPGLLSDQPQDS